MQRKPEVPVHDDAKLKGYIRQCVTEVKKGPYIKPLCDFGTNGDTDDLNASGRASDEELLRGTFEEWTSLLERPW